VRDYHLDCFSGLAGDMFLGACLDLGMPLAVVEEALAALSLPGVTVESRRAQRGGLAGTRFRVLLDGRPIEGPDPGEDAAGGGTPHGVAAHPHLHPHAHPHLDARDPSPAAQPIGRVSLEAPPGGHHHGRSLREILDLLRRSALPPAVRDRSVQLFARLGEAEAAVHGVDVERVHFHEVGAVDSIVDLVGAVAAIEHLAPRRLTCGPVNVGGGTVQTAHGELPAPAPATARLLHGVPVYGSAGGELLTPTGAVLLAELVDEFTDLPALVLDGAGYGLGRWETPGRPNAARLLRGGGRESAAEVMVVECEVDDLPAEGFGFLLERLLQGGVLDVYFTAVQMKKNRPGTLVTVLCRREQLETLAGVLLAESGSLGCRFQAAGRFEAERALDRVATPYGEVTVKRARFAGRELAAAPEYEDCRRLALARGVPWREVYRAALAALAAGPGAPG
jgi:uncharacterized protein (TIGR00299 family) protein